MHSFFEMGFNDRWKRPVLGQLDWIAPLVSASLQAGASVYGAQMQKNIAEMQKKTQEDIANKQAAQQQSQQQAAQQQQQAQVKQQAAQSAASPKILGVDRTIFIVGSVGLVLAIGVIAIVSSKKTPMGAPQMVWA